MPKIATKFRANLQAQFPFLKLVDGNEKQVFCSICSSKFAISNGGRFSIMKHVDTQKHIKASARVNNSNHTMFSFLGSHRTVDHPCGKELTADISMEKDELIVLQVDDHIYNCRLCFKPFSDHKKSVEITETIKQMFFDLTQLQLIQDEAFSNMICIVCSSELELFSKYRSSILERQKKLYEIGLKSVDNNLEDLQKDRVKEEPFDDFETGVLFIECKDFLSSGDKTSKLFQETAVKKKKQLEFDDHQKIFDGVTEISKTTKSKTIQCPKCNETLLHRDFLKEHLCSVNLQTRPLMHLKNEHKKKVTNKSAIKGKQECDHCGATVKDMRRHIMKVHLNVRNFFCDICPYGAFFKYDLANHMKVHIKKVEKYFCDMCGHKFDKRISLTAHIKGKHIKRIHQCTVCKKTFSSAKALRSHAESHGARDKPCEFCGKLFTCKKNLRTHLYMHSDPKFVCDFPNCDRKFFRKRHHRAHLKTHRGQKDFICEICDKSFYSQTDLKRHTISIHKKLRFYCQVPGCQGNFSRQAYYKKHAMAYHLNLGTDYLEKLLQDIKVAIPLHKG